MKFLFLIILSLHALIHLFGFVKSFGLAEIKALVQPVSKPFGLLWMAASCLLLTSVILLSIHQDMWWIYGSAGLILSQILIVLFWKDAKFGTLANLIVLVGLIIGFGMWNFHRQYSTEVARQLSFSTATSTQLLTEADLQPLPDLVKNYIRRSGSLNQPKVNHFRVDLLGKIRKNEQSEWMSLTSQQYNFMRIPVRLFFLNAVMKQLPVAGFHCFINGNAFMDIRLLSLIKVQYMHNKEMGIAETVTFFNDMCCMAPATLIDPRIKWLLVTKDQVKASFTNNGITISAWLTFNKKGELINFVSDDRFAATSSDRLQKLRWETPLKNYKSINGRWLAGDAEAIYLYPDRDLCYGTFHVVNVKYN